MTLQLIPLVLLSTSLLFVSSITPTYLAHHCYKVLDNINRTLQITSNSDKLIFTRLFPEIHRHHYYIGTEGEELTKAYALGQCAPHVSDSYCSSCIQNASYYMISTCSGNVEGFVWYSDCFVRYSDTPFFGVPATDPSLFLQTSLHLFQRPSSLLPLLTHLSEVAALHSRHLYATSAFVFERWEIYALVECTRDLSAASCLYCLHTAVSAVSSSSGGKTGFSVLLPSCSLRYDTYRFYRAGTNEKRWVLYEIAVPIAAVSVLVVVCVWIYRQCGPCKTKNGETVENMAVLDDKPKLLPLSAVKDATRDFCAENTIGKGGSSTVYKGLLDGREVAFKRLTKRSDHSLLQFQTEVSRIAKFQHRNLVRLLGYCTEDTERILVCEYVSNGSLERYLSGDKQGQLTWSERARIVEGIARGISYLHEDSPVTVIHRDLKPENILLDNNMTPKISDFGLSQTFEDQRVLDTDGAGTEGYKAPEYAIHHNLTTKCDIYSFGIIILEILCGRRRHSYVEFAQHAYKLWLQGRWVELIDPLLHGSYDETEAKKHVHIALLCLQDVDDRPTISTVSLMFSTFPDMPQPTCPYYVGRDILQIPPRPDVHAPESLRKSKSLGKERSGEIELAEWKKGSGVGVAVSL